MSIAMSWKRPLLEKITINCFFFFTAYKIY